MEQYLSAAFTTVSLCLGAPREWHGVGGKQTEVTYDGRHWYVGCEENKCRLFSDPDKAAEYMATKWSTEA